MCFAPFDYNVSETVSITPQRLEINAVSQFQNDANQITISTAIADPIHLRFPFRAITEKLATDPKFQIFCPIPGVATRLRALTPQAWWTDFARDDVVKDLPSFSFNLDLFRKPIDIGGVAVAGRVHRTERGIGGVFTAATRGAP